MSQAMNVDDHQVRAPQSPPLPCESLTMGRPYFYYENHKGPDKETLEKHLGDEKYKVTVSRCLIFKAEILTQAKSTAIFFALDEMADHQQAVERFVEHYEALRSTHSGTPLHFYTHLAGLGTSLPIRPVIDLRWSSTGPTTCRLTSAPLPRR